MHHVFNEFFISFRNPSSFDDQSNGGDLFVDMGDFLDQKTCNILPSSLSEIFTFCDLVQGQLQGKPARVIFCSGPLLSMKVGTIMLLGCFMISQGMDPGQLYKTLRQFRRSFTFIDGLSVLDIWHALWRASLLRWVCFEDDSRQEYVHYASSINGGLFHIIPNRLLVFQSNYEVFGEEPLWRDTDGHREFSTLFYADLFESMGVSLVLRLAQSRHSNYDPDVFTSRDIGFEDLRTDIFGSHITNPLRVLDRLMAVMDHCPGLVALECDGEHVENCTIIAALLARRQILGPREATAWVRIACLRPKVSSRSPKSRIFCPAVHDVQALELKSEAPNPGPGGINSSDVCRFSPIKDNLLKFWVPAAPYLTVQN